MAPRRQSPSSFEGRLDVLEALLDSHGKELDEIRKSQAAMFDAIAALGRENAGRPPFKEMIATGVGVLTLAAILVGGVGWMITRSTDVFDAKLATLQLQLQLHDEGKLGGRKSTESAR
jgi:hypothetical protein